MSSFRMEEPLLYTTVQNFFCPTEKADVPPHVGHLMTDWFEPMHDITMLQKNTFSVMCQFRTYKGTVFWKFLIAATS